MRRYELTFVVDPDISDDKRGQIFERTKGLIEKENGLLVDFDVWGQKKLAYEIRKKTRGYYVCMNFCGEANLVDELERTFRLDDKLLKYMTILLEKHANMDDVKAEIDSKEAEKAETKKPEVKKTAPEVKKTAPEVKKAAPEVKKETPDTSEVKKEAVTTEPKNDEEGV